MATETRITETSFEQLSKELKGKMVLKLDSPVLNQALPTSCGICLEEVGSGDLFSLCGNPEHSFCRDCQVSYVSSHVKDGMIEMIACSHPKCESKSIHLNTIKSLVPPEVFSRYERLQLERALDAMPDVMWCPRTSCGKPVVVSLRKNQGRCSSCDYCFCIKCKESSHFGGCQLNSQDILGAEMQDWLLKNTRQCPHCHIFIQKNGGCDHHFCTRCMRPFNWSNARAGIETPFEVERGVIKATHVSLTPRLRLKPAGEVQNPSRKCFNCRALVVKKTHANLLTCTNCKQRCCFECGVMNPPSSHFLHPNRCRQHSPLPNAPSSSSSSASAK